MTARMGGRAPTVGALGDAGSSCRGEIKIRKKLIYILHPKLPSNCSCIALLPVGIPDGAIKPTALDRNAGAGN